LNHVPTSGSVLQVLDYPGNTSRIALTQDELAATLELYPPTPGPAITSISGRVTRSSTGVFGAYVVAFQNGVPVVGGITDPNGNYSIRGLPSIATAYTVRAVTVKRPSTAVSPYYSTLDHDFLSESYLNASTDPATVVTTVPGGNVPSINIDVAGANTADSWEPDGTQAAAKPIAVGTRQIHHSFPTADIDVVSFTATAGNLYLIETSNLGSGNADSDTTIRLRNPSFGILETNTDLNPKQKSRTSRIARRAAVSGTHYVEIFQSTGTVAGSGTAYDILVTDLGPATPTATVTTVTPNTGSQSGGYQVSVIGSNFLPGAGVIFGGTPANQAEVDWVTPMKLFVTVPAHAPGLVNVVVTNLASPSGSLTNGFTYFADITESFVDSTAAAYGTTLGATDAMAWVDYDSDGDLDSYLTQSLAAALFENDDTDPFMNVSVAAGITAGDNNPESVAWGDYNNDGCIDVYKLNGSSPKSVISQEGDLRSHARWR